MSRRGRIKEKVLSRIEYVPHPKYGMCWIWQGPTSGDVGRGAGYPRMSLDGATVAVHITMWVNENGIVPPRKQIDHRCMRRLCVNPDHLEMVTHKVNQKRRDEARKLLIVCEEIIDESGKLYASGD